MEPRLNIITLVVGYLDKAVAFYLDGLGGITLAQNVSDKKTVDLALSQTVKASGILLKSAREVESSGYSGYFADPDEHTWEVAWNPFFIIEHGQLQLPAQV